MISWTTLVFCRLKGHPLRRHELGSGVVFHACDCGYSILVPGDTSREDK